VRRSLQGLQKGYKMNGYDRKWQTHPLVREDAPKRTKTVSLYRNKNLVMSPRRGSTPRLTDWLTVSPVTLALTVGTREREQIRKTCARSKNVFYQCRKIKANENMFTSLYKKRVRVKSILQIVGTFKCLASEWMSRSQNVCVSWIAGMFANINVC
jgi:hypothetical protein